MAEWQQTAVGVLIIGALEALLETLNCAEGGETESQWTGPKNRPRLSIQQPEFRPKTPEYRYQTWAISPYLSINCIDQTTVLIGLVVAECDRKSF